MPYERPGERYYPVAATKAVAHGAPVTEDGIVGVAIKQQAPPFGTGLNEVDADSNPLLTTIEVDEDFVIDIKGIVEVPATGGAAKGALVYITEADNTLADTSGSGKIVFGRTVELAGERGTPTGKMRVNLDLKV